MFVVNSITLDKNITTNWSPTHFGNKFTFFMGYPTTLDTNPSELWLIKSPWTQILLLIGRLPTLVTNSPSL